MSRALIGFLLGATFAATAPPAPALEVAPPGESAVVVVDEAGAVAEPSALVGGDSDFPSQLFVFMLATFIGLGVITRVSRLLHTPLMSITNAISAIAVVGAIIVVSDPDHPTYITVLGAVALFASMTNIVSGFLITDRMLKMFKQREPEKP
jgi:NAD(P) transhydrogenase subunit alpha